MKIKNYLFIILSILSYLNSNTGNTTEHSEPQILGSIEHSENRVSFALQPSSCNLEKPIFINIQEDKYTIEDYRKFVVTNYGAKCRISGFVINGLITKVTTKKVEMALTLAGYLKPAQRFDDEIWLWLDSPGGLVSEAIKIGNKISTRNVKTVLVAGAECYSSCVLIYAAGKWRAGQYGKIGVHRPFSYEISTLGLDYREYQKRYDVVFKEIAEYLARNAVSPAVTNRMKTVPSDKIEIIDATQLDKWGLGAVNVARMEFDKALTIELCGKDYYENNHIAINAFLENCHRNTFSDNCSELAAVEFPKKIQSYSKCSTSLLFHFIEVSVRNSNKTE